MKSVCGHLRFVLLRFAYVLRHPLGLSFMARSFPSEAQGCRAVVQASRVEADQSIGVDQQYHAYPRGVFKSIGIEEPRLSPELTLR